jgi:hypothetical protein
MFLHLEQVEPRAGHRLFVRFDNGVSGELSLFDELWGEMFLPLRDEAAFNTAYLDPVMRTVAWANGADFAPEFLLDLLNKQIGNVA